VRDARLGGEAEGRAGGDVQGGGSGAHGGAGAVDVAAEGGRRDVGDGAVGVVARPLPDVGPFPGRAAAVDEGGEDVVGVDEGEEGEEGGEDLHDD